MNLANKLTFFRISLVPFFIVFLFVDNLYTRILALIVFIIASLTDYYDGKIARSRGEITNFGKFFDPLADKLIVSAALIAFVEKTELMVPAWMVVLIISREFLITGLRNVSASKGIVIPASPAGKFKTTSQVVAIITILAILIIRKLYPNIIWPCSGSKLFRIGSFIVVFGPYWLILVTTILTLISGFFYIKRHWNILMGDI